MEESNSVEVRVIFFAKSRELCGITESKINVPSRTTGQILLEKIVAYFPCLSVIRDNLLLSVNQEYLEQDSSVILKGGEEIAIIPPISGG